jgi:hypothetical protein
MTSEMQRKIKGEHEIVVSAITSHQYYHTIL